MRSRLLRQGWLRQAWLRRPWLRQASSRQAWSRQASSRQAWLRRAWLRQFAWPRRWAPALAALLAVTLLVGARLALPAAAERARLASFDLLQRLSPRVPTAPSPVAVVDIDDESLERLGQWPWSRDIIARLITVLQDFGAAAIGFDSVFAEPDRTSPTRLAAQLGSAAGTLRDYDADLAAAVARGRVVLGFGLLSRPGGRAPDIKAGFATIGGDPAATVGRFAGAVTNLPALEAEAEGVGSFSFVPGLDQMVRRMPLLQALGDQLVPSLVLEALRVARHAETVAVRAERAGGATGQLTGYAIRVGELTIPADADGAIWLHHAPSDPAARIAVWRLLDPGATPAEAGRLRDAVNGRIILIGASAAGLVDLRSTPLDPFKPGVEINTGAVEQILAGRFPRRPLWAGAAELLLALALAALLGVTVCVAGMAAAGTLAIVAAAGLLATAWAGFQHALLLDPTLPLAAVALSFLVAGLVRYFGAERAALRLRAAFAKYLSPHLVDQLARDPGQLRLGGELRDMTFLFTDLEGFTALTETQGAEALVDLLNLYLDGLCSIAFAHGGTLDKIVGDALHVMFNAPLAQPDHAARAVRCALELDRFGIAFAAAQAARGLAFGRTRIGVNTGRAVVGNFGGSRRFDYTAHGDAINTAARLEAANKTLGTRICVAGATAEHVRDIQFRPVGTLMLRGKASGVEVFEPLNAGQDASGWALAYREAFDQMSRDEPAGAEAMLALHATYPDDPLPKLHAKRIRDGANRTIMAA